MVPVPVGEDDGGLLGEAKAPKSVWEGSHVVEDTSAEVHIQRRDVEPVVEHRVAAALTDIVRRNPRGLGHSIEQPFNGTEATVLTRLHVSVLNPVPCLHCGTRCPSSGARLVEGNLDPSSPRGEIGVQTGVATSPRCRFIAELKPHDFAWL